MTQLHISEKTNNIEAGENDESSKLATRDIEALLHVVKSSLGSGVLAMPVAFKNAGLLQGFLGTIFVGLLCTHGTHLLVKASQKMCYTLKKKSLGYAETVEAVFMSSPHESVKSYASLSRKVVDTFLFLTYFGSNAVYVVIVASTLQEVIKNQFNIEWNIRWFMIICIFPLLIIGIIRSMKYLVPFSVLANIFLLVGLVMIFYYVLQDIPPLSSRPLFVTYKKFPLFFSTVISGLEGIGTILPIENSMRNPHHFLGCHGVLNSAMVIVVTLFTSVGFFGYLKYGDSVSGSITLNLPQFLTAELIKILVGLAILFTYGLQMTAVMEVAWSSVENKIKKKNQDLCYYILRGFLVVATVLCAIAVPQLAPAISLIGAVGFSTLGLLIPALLDVIIISEEGIDLFDYIIWKNILIMLLSVFTLFSGSYVSVLDIVQQYR
ncbi:proton-coupled amino acid transporter-like protein pathetic isoform X2 [Lycorma delicatula]|uniref:proton-coupled amino acid transporter-like protein pathetic isoform X2 n=1 Tax=Lycorma delicatula TaxID=130591 RepID=UPI003F517645